MSAPDALLRAVASRLAARPLVLLLDVDGTLAPIAATPEAAAVPPTTQRSLQRLVQAPGVHVALVSGRAARDARRMVGVPGVWAIGNHGFETITPTGDLVVEPAVAPFRRRVAAAAAAIAPHVERIPGAVLEDKSWTLSVHYRRAAAGTDAALRDRLQAIAAEAGLKLTEGKMVFELRPPLAVDKGTAALALVRRLVADGGAALYAGDDRTDEDAFAALRHARAAAVTIRIMPEAGEAAADSAAEFVLPSVDAMASFLARLADDVAAHPAPNAG